MKQNNKLLLLKRQLVQAQHQASLLAAYMYLRVYVLLCVHDLVPLDVEGIQLVFARRFSQMLERPRSQGDK